MLNNSAPTDKLRKEYAEDFSNKLLKHLITFMVKVLHIGISNLTIFLLKKVPI